MIIRPIRSFSATGGVIPGPPASPPAQPEPVPQAEDVPPPFQPGSLLPPPAARAGAALRHAPAPSIPPDRKRWPAAKRRLTPF